MNITKFKKINATPIPIEIETIQGVGIPCFTAEGRRIYFHECLAAKNPLLPVKVFPPYDLPEFIQAVDPTIYSDPLYIEFVTGTDTINIYKYDRK